MSFNGNVGSDNDIPYHAAAKSEITSDILVGGRVVDSFPGQVFGRLVRTRRIAISFLNHILRQIIPQRIVKAVELYCYKFLHCFLR